MPAHELGVENISNWEDNCLIFVFLFSTFWANYQLLALMGDPILTPSLE